MKKLIALSLASIGITAIAIYSMAKEEIEEKKRAEKALEEKKRLEQESRLNEAFRRMSEELKNFHDDIVRRMDEHSI